ncbi:hypothetical protein ACFU5B_04845 [Streptomyces murinus]|uniref:hypothetical protein n=1 Tax=Streptomyces murinus TaxID=33900 RepID=UPI0036403467
MGSRPSATRIPGIRALPTTVMPKAPNSEHGHDGAVEQQRLVALGPAPWQAGPTGDG